jgi:CBS-domain-containing membrane protein
MLERSRFLAIVAGAAGGATAIGIREAFSIRAAFPLVAIPFATSIVLVLGSPKAGPAQPRAPIGGHLLSTIVGLSIVKLCGPLPWAAALAVGLAMIVMHVTDTFHPPAGIDPLVIVTINLSWSLLIVPVGVGALLLALFAFAWHNLVARGANKGDTWLNGGGSVKTCGPSRRKELRHKTQTNGVRRERDLNLIKPN